MGKAAMCIRMLQILNTGRTYKVSELADLLDTNPRNVIEYKKELDEVAAFYGAGFYIDTIPGRYGGYKLRNSAILPSLTLTETEKASLVEGVGYLSARNDFMKKKELQIAMGKILSTMTMSDIRNEDSMLVINRYPLAMSEEDIRERFDILKSAIKKKVSVSFTYLTQKNELKERLLDPYDLVMYNNAYFVIGWLHSENRPDIYPFKLNRISNLKITDKKFSIWKYYNKTKFVDEHGFKTNGEWHHVEFIATGSYASLVKERIYGKNQVVEPIDANSTKVIVDMQNEENIRVFVLGFGKNIKVLKPEWLIDDLKEISQHILNEYK